jgi:hypothetical protein
MEAADVPKKVFNPFCSVDGMQLSIHCHINAVKTLVCAPGQVAKDRKSICVCRLCMQGLIHGGGLSLRSRFYTEPFGLLSHVEIS